MTIAKHTRPDRSTLLVVTGDLDVASAGRVRDAGSELLAAGGGQLVVDLIDVVFIDSSGLGALIGLRNDAILAAASLVLLEPSERVMSLLNLTGLANVFDVKRTN